MKEFTTENEIKSNKKENNKNNSDSVKVNKKSEKESNKNKENKTSVDTTKNTIKRVVTRFPPEPSGMLHIGHAKALLINTRHARQSKKGKLIIRFDDTNPLKENQSFVDSIKHDIQNLLKIEPDQWSFTSDYFKYIQYFAKLLIENGLAYLDNTDFEEMKRQRFCGEKSKNRDLDVEENLKIFERFVKGEEPKYCVRAKIDYENVNKAMRDPVIYRFVDKTHHRSNEIGGMCVYPTYDLACPIVDCLEGVTHAFRTNEYRDRNKVYEWIVKHIWNKKEIKDKFLEKFKENIIISSEEEKKFVSGDKNELKKLYIDPFYKGPEIKDFGKLSFENTLLSKRKLTSIINENNLTWEDPRIPTLRGLKNRGLDMEVLMKYINNTGMKQKCVVASWDKVWAENRKYQDLTAKRIYGVESNESVDVEIENFSEIKEFYCEKLIKLQNNESQPDFASLSVSDFFYLNIDKNKKKPEMGQRKIKVTNDLIVPDEGLEEDTEITLMNLGNFIVKNVEKKSDMDRKKVILQFNKDGSYKTTTFKLQWVSKKYNQRIIVSEYGDLCIEGTETFNKNSISSYEYFIEESIENVPVESVVQIERVSFCFWNGKNLNEIPFTRQLRKK